MVISESNRREAVLAAVKQELERLEASGARVCGNAFSPVLLVKGDLNEREREGADVLSGADGMALRAALTKLGYAPEEFCALAATYGEGDASVAWAFDYGDPLSPELFREALEAIDPEAVILLDDAAASVMREAYAEELAQIEQFDVALLSPGLVARVLGRRVLALGGFEASLSDAHEKQRMWAYLKQVPPLGAPY